MTRRWAMATLLVVAAAGVAAAQSGNVREDFITRAQVWSSTDVAKMDLFRGPDGPARFEFGEEVRCRYTERVMNGRSPKFACVRPDGDELKVKYGETNGEVHGEVAATRLLWALGFGADAMYSVRVICTGCPDGIGSPTGTPGERLVDPAVIERKLPGREITGANQPGWSWLELDLIDEEGGGATRAERDALRLLAVFLQHTDSKPEQQRLVCLDQDEGMPAGTPCQRPMMMINDVGLTFGRANLMNANLIGSVNFEEWSRTPVWKDDTRCVGNLPRSLTGTLKDPVISEEGREFLAERLSALSDAQIRGMFEAARIELRAVAGSGNGAFTGPASHSIDEWVRVFKAKRAEIVDRRCDVLWPEGIAALFGTSPIHWLQDRSSHALTMVMNGVSVFGYTRVYMGLATVLAFMYGLRAGVALLLLLALNGVMTDGAKAIVAAPRPAAVDPSVQTLDAVFTLSTSLRGETVNHTVDTEDGYGFPSGHVAVTTAFFFGLGHFFGWRWAWPAMAVLIPAMAVSRMYLGRHFLGDVLGGLGIGVVAVALGVLALTLVRLTHDRRATQPAHRAALLAGCCAMLALLSGIGPYDAGRLLGLAAAAVLLVHTGLDQHLSTAARTAHSPRVARVARVVAAAVIYFGLWRATNAALNAADMLHTPEGALIAGAFPAFMLLPAPLYLERLAGTMLTSTRRLVKNWAH